jgi:hypothetical protein
MCTKPNTINLVTKLWRSIDANPFFQHALFEILKVARIVIAMQNTIMQYIVFKSMFSLYYEIIK